MKIHYYAETDTLHIEFRDVPVAETRGHLLRSQWPISAFPFDGLRSRVFILIPIQNLAVPHNHEQLVEQHAADEVKASMRQ